MRDVVTDIETYRNYFLICCEDVAGGKQTYFEVRGERDILDYKRLRTLLFRNRIITYNGTSFDLPIIMKAIDIAEENEGWVEPAKLHQCAEKIIKGSLRYWQVPDALGVVIPSKIDHIDLIEPQPNAFASLKILNGRLHGRWMKDLPYDPANLLTNAQMDEVLAYCWNDLDATKSVFKALKEPLQLRAALSSEYGEDFRSKSDSQIGERIIRKRVQDMLGRKIERQQTAPGSTFKYEIPDFIDFGHPALRNMTKRLSETEFIVGHDGKIALPSWIKETPIQIGETVYAMGIGGLHSTESNRAIFSDQDSVLIDADVGSYYPAIILNSGLYPKSLGPEFLEVYRGIRSDRMKAKREKDKVKDKGFKIALNGSFGKLGSKWSILHAPHLLITVTLTGQLALLSLIERAERAGIPVVSANTDGVVFRCPRNEYHGIEKDRLVGGRLKEITCEWETDTGFDLEFTEYEASFNQSVNSYFAVKPGGKIKQKGPFANPWRDDDNLREQLMKNPQMSILSDAVVEKILHNTPIENTIRSATDPRGFVTVVNVTGGAFWGDPNVSEDDAEYLGKVVRYYWTNDDGRPIHRAKPNSKGNHNKVAKTDGCAPMMTLPDTLPDDIDYQRYIAEAEKILREIGYYAPRPKRLSRVRRKATFERAAAWTLAA